METALRLLTRRDHTRGELQRKLKQRGVSAGVIQDVLAQCKRLNYVNDNRSARSYVQELQRKGYGPRRIRLALKRKGLSEQLIEKSLSDPDIGGEELETALRVFEKKRRQFDRETDGRKRRAKIYRFLYSRGFSPWVISELIRQSGPDRHGGEK